MTISGHDLIRELIYLIAIALIFGLLWWLIDYCALPAPFAKVARVILAVAAVLFLINAILSLVGQPLVVWR